MIIKMKKAIISLGVSLLIGIFSFSQAVTVWTLKWKFGSNPDVSVGQTQIEWSRSILDIISVVNSYLRFAIGFVCFLFMIWNGYQLIMARGDDKQMKSATNSLVWTAVWLWVCLLSYIIVNIALRLFM